MKLAIRLKRRVKEIRSIRKKVIDFYTDSLLDKGEDRENMEVG